MTGPAPYFVPWIGAGYGAADERLLILGESHYGPPTMAPDSTRLYTQGYVDGENHRFWTNVMQTIQGEPAGSIDRAAFWARVAFYNFVQQPVAETAGVAPTPAMFAAANAPFFTVLADLKPTAVLVLSRRLWDNLPADGTRGPDVHLADEARDAWVYDYDGGRALATWIPHPSRYFSWSRWHPWFIAFRETCAAFQRRSGQAAAA